jgi:hypothetical protein
MEISIVKNVPSPNDAKASILREAKANEDQASDLEHIDGTAPNVAQWRTIAANLRLRAEETYPGLPV